MKPRIRQLAIPIPKVSGLFVRARITQVTVRPRIQPTSLPGRSAYQIAVDSGFEGTEAEWLASLGAGLGAYRGVWNDITDYVQGDMTSSGFALWMLTTESQTGGAEPGMGGHTDPWTLVVQGFYGISAEMIEQGLGYTPADAAALAAAIATANAHFARTDNPHLTSYLQVGADPAGAAAAAQAAAATDATTKANAAQAAAIAASDPVGSAAAAIAAHLAAADPHTQYVLATLIGQALGIAPLGSDGKVATTFLPASILGQVEFKALWDATSGAPTATPEKGWYYIVNVAGATSLDGISDWQVGDWAIHNGTVWGKVDNTDAVASVAGLTGSITAAALKIALAYSKADIGLGSVDNTSDVDKPVSTAQAAADAAVLSTVVGYGYARVQVDTFTASGTWTKPAWAKVVEVTAIAGGGGGAGGAVRTVGTAIVGGGGGGAGGRSRMMFPAAVLGATEAVVVGAGGPGGAGRTISQNTTGVSGSAGGDSTFGVLLRANGGGAGSGAGTAGAAGPSGLISNGGTGGVGSTGAAAAAQGGNVVYGSFGGGGGGGIGTDGTTRWNPAGSRPGTDVLASGLTTSELPSTTNVTGQGANGNIGSAYAPALLAGGGGGGASSTTGNGGAGGNGGGYGAGGGGGGGGVNGTGGSGAGGNGSDGYIRVVSYG